jgi:hypothetical protein
MRFLVFGVILSLAVTGSTQGQRKKKLPALAFDARLIKFDEKNGMPTKAYYETSLEDSKKLGFKTTDTPITRGTRFVFVGPGGDKVFTQKTVFADKEARQHLQKDSMIRVQVTAIETEELRFGPALKPQGPRRVR